MTTCTPVLHSSCGRCAAIVVALLFGLTLAGCGSRPLSPEPSGGGYYQDDGPHAEPPADLALVPDASPREEPLHRFANRPYKVMGQAFTPSTAVGPFRQRGRASWYGRKFHGKATASGEPYDMYKMTAAHPTLPIPSYARVTHLENRRSVVVRINDRGPFLHGRVIDLSYTAAYKLGYIEAGSAQVEVEAIVPGEVAVTEPEQPVPPLRRPGVSAAAEPMAVALTPPSEVRMLEVQPLPPARLPLPAATPAATPAVAPAATPAAALPPVPASGGVPRAFVQLGAFASRENAEGFRAMAAEELAESPDALLIVPEGLRFRLQLGPYATVEEARSRADSVGAALKIKPFVVMR